MTLLRSILFYLGYSLATIIWGTLSVLVGWLLPYRLRFQFIIGTWTRACLFWLRVTCGIRHEIEGKEHIPAEPCVGRCGSMNSDSSMSMILQVWPTDLTHL